MGIGDHKRVFSPQGPISKENYLACFQNFNDYMNKTFAVSQRKSTKKKMVNGPLLGVLFF
jgi:hypothetical protein